MTVGYASDILDRVTNITYRASDGSLVRSFSYTYDALGRRVSTTDSSGTVWHVYDGDECVADLDASGNPLRSYTWGQGIDDLLAITVYTSGATNSYYAVKDHLGSVQALVDASGAVVQSYTYDAWGNITSSFNILPSSFSCRYLWQGREYSAATGLYNFRARWYEPRLGRWLSDDPIGISGGLNLYEFCGNNPVNFRDPNGLFVTADDNSASGLADTFLGHWNRNVGVNEPWQLPPTEQDAIGGGWRPLRMSKSIFHMRHGRFINKKYVSPDGHREAVYDENGCLVTDPYNRGTFNYFDPESNPKLHALIDVVPYYLLGNSPADAFDYGDRIEATVEGAVLGLLGY